MQNKNIQQQNDLIWSWTWQNINKVNRIDDNFNK